MDHPQTFGQWLRSRRRELDLTQSELARRVSCASVTIKKIEANELRPSRQLAEILVKHLGVAGEDREALIRFARGGKEPTAVSFRIPKNNLPIELSSFVGRERELLEIKQSVLTSRLVTLTGVGGVGKTRLAIQSGVELLNQFSHGAWFVELAPISNPGILPETLLSIFQLSDQENKSPLETLQDYLQAKQMLIILDNCEHLIDAATQFAQALLKNSPGLKILATSRETMNVSGEKICQVPPLPLLDLKTSSHPITQLTQSAAVRLFIERASYSSSKFQVDENNISALVEICHRLDGLPLAIELAAARTRMMDLNQINAHLDDRFRLLIGGDRTALPRQKALRTLIDWSYDLLSIPERVMLQRVSIYVNGWTLEATKHICSDEKLAGHTPLDLLSNLIDKSLIQWDEHSDGARYRMLETIRQYALEKLIESGEYTLTGERHLMYFVEFAEAAEQKLRTQAQREVVLQLQADLDNLRGALAWAFSQSIQPVAGLRLACALKRFTEWDALLLREQLEWYQTGLTLLQGQTDVTILIRAKAMCLAGGLMSHFGNYLIGQTMLDEGVDLFRQEPRADPKDLSFVLNILALVYYMDDPPKARALGQESIQISRALEATGTWHLAEALRMNGWVAYWQNDFDLARARAEEGYSLFRSLGDDFSVSDTLHLLGQIAHLNGNFAVARPYYTECLNLNQNTGLKEYEMLALSSLADLDLLTGNVSAARAQYETVLEFYQAHGDRLGEGKTLTSFARVAIIEGKHVEAIPLLYKGMAYFQGMYRYVEMGLGLHALADVLRAKGNLEHATHFLGAIYKASQHFKPINQIAYHQSVEATRAAMEPNAFLSAWETGLGLTLDEAVTLALSDPV